MQPCVYIAIQVTIQVLYSMDKFGARNISYNHDLAIDTNDQAIRCIEKILDSVNCKSFNDLRSDSFTKPRKDTMGQWIVDLCGTLIRSTQFLRAAASSINDLQSETIQGQNKIIELQDQVIKNNAECVEEVQATVKSEITSYRDAVENSCSKSFDSEKLRNVVKHVVIEEDRSRNLMVYGLEENENEDLQAKASDMLEQLGEKPHITGCCRVGKPSTDSGQTRPVKLMLHSSDIVQHLLRRSSGLKQINSFKRVFFAPDRSTEARLTHKKLVAELRENIKKVPNLYLFIKDGKISSVAKK